LFNNIDNYIELRPVQIKVVLDSNGVNLMTNNFVKDKNIETQITSYLDKGVVFEVCEKTMSKKNMTKDEFIKGSTFIKFAIQRYVELCRDGFIGVEQQ
jgi:intracellular sulfur oxidation DsrE/DsrF family protein